LTELVNNDVTNKRDKPNDTLQSLLSIIQSSSEKSDYSLSSPSSSLSSDAMNVSFVPVWYERKIPEQTSIKETLSYLMQPPRQTYENALSEIQIVDPGRLRAAQEATDPERIVTWRKKSTTRKGFALSTLLYEQSLSCYQ